MERIPTAPPQIAPLPPDTNRPLWSVMIPAYNCSSFLAETMRSILDQQLDWGNFQIEVVDDYSTDADVEQLVKTVGEGKISYYRQPRNVGSLRNFETCLNRSRGHYIHLLHGDDRVKNNFYSRFTELFNQFPTAGAVFCSYDYIDASGKFAAFASAKASEACILEDCLERLSVNQLLQVVTIAVKREVYEKLGSFYNVTYGEDWEMWARIAKSYPIAYTPERLAEYRLHDDSISGTTITSGQSIKDIIKISKVICSYLPVEKQKSARKLLYQNYAEYLISKFYNQTLLYKKPKKLTLPQLFHTMRICQNRRQAYSVLQLLYLNTIKQTVKRMLKR